MKDELYQFLACDYYATGEGCTVSILITRAYPRAEDYETGTDKPQIAPGRTAKVRAAREFTEQFGSWYAQGVENLERQEFLERFGSYLPWYVKNILTSTEIPGNFNYITQLHINYS
jgi:hypothetical protein